MKKIFSISVIVILITILTQSCNKQENIIPNKSNSAVSDVNSAKAAISDVEDNNIKTNRENSSSLSDAPYNDLELYCARPTQQFTISPVIWSGSSYISLFKVNQFSLLRTFDLQGANQSLKPVPGVTYKIIASTVPCYDVLYVRFGADINLLSSTNQTAKITYDTSTRSFKVTQKGRDVSIKILRVCETTTITPQP